jgi:hypothetical protein
MRKPRGMPRRLILLFSLLLLGTGSSSVARTGPRSAVLWDRTDRGFNLWNGPGAPQSTPAPSSKSCSEVYPIPEAAKHWTDCKAGQFSRCGGPEECTCNDPGDRLVWYECKQGSYAHCEDDHTCADSCRY